jgi:hypothetical protein
MASFSCCIQKTLITSFPDDGGWEGIRNILLLFHIDAVIAQEQFIAFIRRVNFKSYT